MEDSTGEIRRGGRGSLRRTIRLYTWVAVGLVLLGIVFAAIFFGRLLRARGDLVDRVDVAAVTGQRLLATLVEQESGVRGYVLSGDPAFLAPYTTGVATELTIATELEGKFDHFPTAFELFRETRARAEAWRSSYAEPTIAAIRTGDFSPREPAALAEGKALFDALRSSFVDLDAQLARDRAMAKDRLDSATLQLSGVLVSFGLIVLLGGAGVWWIFRSRVRAPLESIGTDARAVSSGELSHTVTRVGPSEFDMLAGDIETMRRRIVDELVTVSEARQELEVQAQALARSNSELEQFAYVASHDLQEPLRKVASFCQLLKSRYGGQLDDKADQYIEFAVDGAKRMQALINDLLAFSRVGRIQGPKVELDANRLAAHAVDNLGERIEAAGATVDVAPLPQVVGEQALLIAVFQNLIGNAIKFAREGVQPHITVSAEPEPAADGGAETWRFSVADNGIGIEPQHADRVFTIFQRLHSKEAYEGTGIGLAMCRKIVEDHGGRIWVLERDPVEAAAAPGTTVCFTLPGIGHINSLEDTGDEREDS